MLVIVFAIVLRLTSDDNDTLARVRFLSDRVVSLVAIMLVVVFQPELRQAMITLGQAKLFGRRPTARWRAHAALFSLFGELLRAHHRSLRRRRRAALRLSL